jgi:hypothetical protein
MIITVGIAIFYFKLPIMWSAIKNLIVMKAKKGKETSIEGEIC